MTDFLLIVLAYLHVILKTVIAEIMEHAKHTRTFFISVDNEVKFRTQRGYDVHGQY